MTRTFASLIAALAITATSVAPAIAEPRTETVSVRVSYADLDLARIEGVKTLTARIDRAIDKACGRMGGKVSLAQTSRIKDCRTVALDKAIAAIDAPLMTALYQRSDVTQIAGR